MKTKSAPRLNASIAASALPSKLVVSVPVAFLLSRYTNLYVVWIFVFLQMADWIKCAIGAVLVRKGVWMNNIVD